MAIMRTCNWCGKKFDNATAGHRTHTGYCSAKCIAAAQASGKGTSMMGASFKNGSFSSGGMKLAIPIVGILIVIGLIGMAVNGIRNVFSDTKIKIVSASCETEERFVSILKEASSKAKASWTVIEGETFATYAGQARDVVKEREGEHGLFKDAVYFVQLPDSINAYAWFKTKDDVTLYVYTTE